MEKNKVDNQKFYDLILSASNNDENAVNILVNKFMFIVENKALKYSNFDVAIFELKKVGTDKLIECIRNKKLLEYKNIGRHNSIYSVYSNILQVFVENAIRSYTFAKTTPLKSIVLSNLYGLVSKDTNYLNGYIELLKQNPDINEIIKYLKINKEAIIKILLEKCRHLDKDDPEYNRILNYIKSINNGKNDITILSKKTSISEKKEDVDVILKKININLLLEKYTIKLNTIVKVYSRFVSEEETNKLYEAGKEAIIEYILNNKLSTKDNTFSKHLSRIIEKRVRIKAKELTNPLASLVLSKIDGRLYNDEDTFDRYLKLLSKKPSIKELADFFEISEERFIKLLKQKNIEYKEESSGKVLSKEIIEEKSKIANLIAFSNLFSSKYDTNLENKRILVLYLGYIDEEYYNDEEISTILSIPINRVKEVTKNYKHMLKKEKYYG